MPRRRKIAVKKTGTPVVKRKRTKGKMKTRGRIPSRKGSKKKIVAFGKQSEEADSFSKVRQMAQKMGAILKKNPMGIGKKQLK